MIAKVAKRKTIGMNAEGRWELRNQLEDILTLRAQGLLNQSEYEAKIEEVERTLARKACLAELDLPSGGTRFVLRETGAGRVLAAFEFRDGHPVEN